MIEQIIQNFYGKVDSLFLFEKIYPLVEQKQIEGRTVLGRYEYSGQFEHITNLDNFNGVAYFRKYEDTSVGVSDIVLGACDNVLAITYPIRFVASIRRDQLPSDCAFSDDALAYFIIQELSGNAAALKVAMKAAKVVVSPTKISTDRKQILSNELPGNELNDINYEFTLISIDFNVVIDIRQSCIITSCETYG